MKTVKGITSFIAVMLFISSQGFSQNSVSDKSQNNQGNTGKANTVARGNFVDSNNDGICDNYQVRTNNGRGANFVDKNGDGICDNRGSGGTGRGKGNGCGMGYQRGHGNGGGAGLGNQRGYGQGRGNCCGRGNGYQHRHGQGN